MEKRPNIKLTLDQGLAVEQDLQPDCSSKELARILGVPKAYLLRRSVDARKKASVHFIATAGVGDGDDAPHPIVPLSQRPLPQKRPLDISPLVVGMGPAGLFAALEMAEAGLCPRVIERGAPVDERAEDVEAFHKTRVLNTASNVQFGEGGAGTFSDGKLTCGKNSPLMAKILQTFVSAGAPQDILWQAKPHIGTDVLAPVVSALRKRIIACGGTVDFHTRLAGLRFENGALSQALLDTPRGQQQVPCKRLVLATGHSARDTFALLQQTGFALEPKPFSLGVRIEHAQELINRAQYGNACTHPALGAADYKLNVHLPSGRGVYTFCMCPGGEISAASSEEGRLTVNGMSYHARAGQNANAALLCGVAPDDFQEFATYEGDPLAGIAFQRHWEHAAFCAGGSDWSAPGQSVGSFLAIKKKPSVNVEPTYPLGICEANLRECLPACVGESLAQALPLLDRKLKGYGDAGAFMTGIEARSSSPVRVLRDAESLQALDKRGVYPCGEGAGYAGGIMSAALDGLRVAQSILSSL